MYDFENLVSEITSNVKSMLTEALSERLYHFCPLNSMYAIAKTDSFKLTSVEERPSDKKLTSLPTGNGERKQYNYYMCFSRTPSSLVGYVAMRRNKTGNFTWGQTLVRMEIDGTKLNANYKGMPVNYFNNKKLDKINHYTDMDGKRYKKSDGSYFTPKKFKVGEKENGKPIYYTNAMKVTALNANGTLNREKPLERFAPHREDKTVSVGRKRQLPSIDYGVIDRNQMLEYEDRLFSNKEYITNVKKMGYIKRIDIYLSPDTIKGTTENSNDAFYMTNEIINFFGEDIVHIFNNFTSFESVNIVNSMDGYDFKKRFLEYSQKQYISDHGNVKLSDIELTNAEIKTIVRYAGILGFFGFHENWRKYTEDNMNYFLEKIGIDINNEHVKKCVNDIINEIDNGGEGFFRKQTVTLKNELEKIPPYKISKYILKLNYFKDKQEETYYLKTGKKISILSIKSGYCKYRNKAGV